MRDSCVLAVILVVAGAAPILAQDMDTPRPIDAVDTVWIEEMTWMEVRDAIADGKTTVIVAAGSLEQNGPYIPTAKHAYVLRATTEAIARKLGNALIAPIVRYEPGDPENPRYPGTIPVRMETYKAILADVVSSLKQHGFRNIVLIGDSGGNQRGLEEVAEELTAAWDGGETAIHFVREYYDSWLASDAAVEQIAGKAEVPEGIHDDYSVTSIIMTVDPQAVRYDQRVAADKASINGISIVPKERAIANGRQLVDIRATATVQAILRMIGEAGINVAAANGQSWRSVALEETAETSANASLGDLDGDGDLDIVLAKGRHWPLVDFVLLNDGDGGFEQRHEVGGSADRTYTAALADLDGDADLDLVVGNDSPDDKRVYFNDGQGHFSLAGTFGDSEWPTRNVTVADLNGDERPEIIVANRGGPDNLNANYVCFNDGNGAFPSCDVLSSESATTIAAGDLTGDGFVDLFVPHRDGGQSYLFVNDGDGGFDERHAVGPSRSATRAVTLGDLDGDGLLDIIVGDQLDGGVWLYVNRGDASFEEPRPIGDPADNVYALAVADLDGDGDDDVVVGNSGAPSAILTNNGSGVGFTRTRFGDAQGAVYGLAIGDVNGDGVVDIVAGRSDAPNTLYLGCCR